MLPGLHAAVNYEVLASFERPGTQVVAPLVRHSGGDFFGVASAGGAGGKGSVFQISAAGELSTLFSFSGTDGQAPAAGLVEGADGSLYGTTSSGGAGNFGVVFKITTAGVFTKLVDFTGTAGAIPGRLPGGELHVAADGTIYGLTQAGGADDLGTLFRYTTTGGLENLVSFTGAAGVSPGSVTANDGAGLAFTGGVATTVEGDIYGVLPGSGEVGGGVAFRVTITTGTAINAWKQTYLGDPNALDEDDFDLDGLPNLLEYALGTLPDFSDAASSPQGFLFTYPDGDRLTLDVLRDPKRNDITLIVEVSATLMPNDWTTLATSTLGAPFTGPGYWAGDSTTPGARYVTIRDTISIAPDLRRFIRLRVIH